MLHSIWQQKITLMFKKNSNYAHIWNFLVQISANYVCTGSISYHRQWLVSLGFLTKFYIFMNIPVGISMCHFKMSNLLGSYEEKLSYGEKCKLLHIDA